MKERFTTEEWEHLRRLPFAIFVVVAGADEAITPDELRRFEDRLNEAATCVDPLERELLLGLLDADVDALLEDVMGALVEELETAKRILAARLSREEYHRFLGSLFTLTLAADESDATKRAAAALVNMLEVDMDAGIASLARL